MYQKPEVVVYDIATLQDIIAMASSRCNTTIGPAGASCHCGSSSAGTVNNCPGSANR